MKIRYIAPVILVSLLGCKEEPKNEGPRIIASAPKKKKPPVAAASASAAAVPAGTFEGEIDISVEMKGAAKVPSVMHMAIKGPKVRFDAPAEAMGQGMAGGSTGLAASKAYQLIAIDEGKMRTVVEAQKMVMEMDISKFAEQMKGLTGAAPSAAPVNEPPPKVSKTGKTDTIVGHSCEEWEVISPKSEKMTLCVGKGGGWPSIPAVLMADSQWAQNVIEKDSFPLRIVLNGSDGAEKMRMQVTRMDNKAIDDAVFAIPEGYRVMNMADMMGAMGAAGAMAAPAGSGSARPQLKLPPNVEKMIEEARAKAAASKSK